VSVAVSPEQPASRRVNIEAGKVDEKRERSKGTSK
jgi:hypothetical protein